MADRARAVEHEPPHARDHRLVNSGGRLIEGEITTAGDWPAAADGAGRPSPLARPSYGEGSEAWAASDTSAGSPGARTWRAGTAAQW
jgi:hypothetical protein